MTTAAKRQQPGRRTMMMSPNQNQNQNAADEDSSPPATFCSILTWGGSGDMATGEGAERKSAAKCPARRIVGTPGDLRGEIASLVGAGLNGPVAEAAAAAANVSSFVDTAGLEKGREEEEIHQYQQKQRQQQRQEQQLQEQAQHRRPQRRPVIVLHGLPQNFLSALLESPLDIDPAFVSAHAQERRYRPRGGHERRPGGAAAGGGEAGGQGGQGRGQERRPDRRILPGEPVGRRGTSSRRRHTTAGSGSSRSSAPRRRGGSGPSRLVAGYRHRCRWSGRS